MSRKKERKVLVFCAYYPPRIGGMETHAREFNLHLSRLGGYKVTVFTTDLPKEVKGEDFCNDEKIREIRFPAFELISNYPFPKLWSFDFWKKWTRLFQEDFDLVISRIRFFPTSLLALIFAKTKKTPWIHIEHSSSFVKLEKKWKSFLAKLYDQIFGKFIFKMSDLNISISEAVKFFVEKFDNRKTPIIYRGIDFNKIDKAFLNNRIKDSHNKDEIVIVVACRLIWWKGVQNIIKAVNLISAENKQKIKLFVCGEGEDEYRLRKMAKGNVFFLGPQKREDVFSLLKTADVYVHASYPGGGLSTTLLEAMYCKCCVIATLHEGANEVIEDGKNGILISESNPKEIKNKIEWVLKNNFESKKMAKAAQEKTRQFSWNETIKKYDEIIKKINRKK
ncbi:MAG: glycosyltransferase family 4 protein [Candidatus Moraniibacteriota bacterium]